MIFKRQPNPPNYADYRLYKPLLRIDFEHRCAYCILHEGDESAGGFHSFHIDHFQPRSIFPTLLTTYSNLCYACRWCNNAKSDTWPTETEQQGGYGFVDPCKEDLYRKHSRLDATSGQLVGTTKPGEYTIREIRLNREMFKKLRRLRIEAHAKMEQTRRRIARLEQEQDPKHELIAELKEKIVLLSEKYINPKIPYEPEGLLVSD